MAVIEGGSSTAGRANVDSNYNLQVNLPTTVGQAGYAQRAFVPATGISKVARITESQGIYTSESRQVLDLDFNSISTVWVSKIGTNATTMTKAASGNGFMRLNNSAITTTTTGISIYSLRTVAIESGYDYRMNFSIKTTNATATNKQAEVGLGYYAFAAGQAAQMNEFIGFRWTTTGALKGVVSSSNGGVPTEQEIDINGGVPYSDGVARDYTVIFNSRQVEFWVDGVFQGYLNKGSGSFAIIKQQALPWIARVFNSGTASAAMTLEVADPSVFKIGGDDGISHNDRMASMGKLSYYWQPDLTTASQNTHNYPASGTAPTAAVGSNTASAANNTAIMGGLIRNTLTGVTATLSTNILWVGYLNPAVPTAAGGANNARNFRVTSISISPMVVTAALTGGGFTAFWFAAIGSTAISLATTSTDGTTALAQKAPVFVPLSLCSTIPATAALGVVSTDVGDHQFIFPSGLVIHPGEFLHIGMRTIAVTAAVTAGAADCNIGVNGVWD